MMIMTTIKMRIRRKMTWMRRRMMMVMMTMMTVYYKDDEPVGIRCFGARISD